MRRMGGKVVILTRGGLEIYQWTKDLVRNSEGFQKSAEAIVVPPKGGMKGRTCGRW